MSDETFPSEAELVAAGAGDLTYVDTGEPVATLPPVLDDVDDMLVVTSLRIPLGLHNRLKDYAASHGVKPSVLIRQWIELHLTADDNRPILLADAIRALSAVRPAA